MQDVAAADREAIDGRNDRFGHLANEPVQPLNLEHAHLGLAVAAGERPFLLVASSAEGSVAGAGEDDRADRAIDPCVAERVDELIDCAAPQRVIALGPVYGDDGDALVDDVVDVGELLEGDHSYLH